MFCPLIKIELKTDYCVSKSCMYKGADKKCHYEVLTQDVVTPQTLAEVKGIKLYKAKALVNEAKTDIEIGLIALRYSEYISDSFPVIPETEKLIVAQTVNAVKDSTKELLKSLFGLSVYQQSKFLDAKRYSAWATRHSVSLEFHSLWEGLIKVGRRYPT